MGIEEFYQIDPSVYGDSIAEEYDSSTQGLPPVAPIVSFLRDLGGSEFLELGVGTGRVAIPLSASGVAVTGVDSSPRMLEILREKDADGRVATRQLDIANLGTMSEGVYDCIFAVYNSFNVLLSQEAQLQCLMDCRRLLGDKGGSVVLEMNAPSARLFETGPQVREMEPGRVALQVKHIDFVKQLLILQRIDISNTTNVTPWVARYVWPAELRLMARLAGFTRIDQYNGWDGAELRRGAGTYISVMSV